MTIDERAQRLANRKGITVYKVAHNKGKFAPKLVTFGKLVPSGYHTVRTFSPSPGSVSDEAIFEQLVVE